MKKKKLISWNLHFWIPPAFWRSTYFWALKKTFRSTSTFPSFRCEVSTSNLEKYRHWNHSWSQQNNSYSNFILVNNDHTSGWTFFKAPLSIVLDLLYGKINRLRCYFSFVFFSIFCYHRKKKHLTIPRLSKSMVIQCNKLLIDSKIEPCWEVVVLLEFFLGPKNQSGPNMGVSKKK